MKKIVKGEEGNGILAAENASVAREGHSGENNSKDRTEAASILPVEKWR